MNSPKTLVKLTGDKLKNISFRRKVSKITDNARKWNKETFLAFFQKKLVNTRPVDDNKSVALKTLHLTGLILGNLVVIALFALLYFIF